jgi:hypothetical protein
MPLVPPNEHGKSAVEALHRHLEEAGRDPAEFGIEPQARIAGGNPDRWRRHASAWDELGASHISIVTMGAGFASPDEHLKAAAEYKAAIG